MTITTPSLDTTLVFIQNYRSLELSTDQIVKTFIQKVATRAGLSYQAQHLFNAWKGKENHFDDFFLNLSTNTKICLLQEWDINDPDDESYLRMVKESEVNALFADAPNTVASMTNLLKFFYNHGIESFPAYSNKPGLHLKNLPIDEKDRYGNASNWAKYLLSLEAPGYVLEQIFSYK